MLTSFVVGRKMWQKHFAQIVLLVLESFKAHDSQTREAGLKTIADMIRNLGSSQFVGYLEIVVARLLDCAKDDSRCLAVAMRTALPRPLRD